MVRISIYSNFKEKPLKDIKQKSLPNVSYLTWATT